MTENTDISPFERHNAGLIADRDQEPIIFGDMVRQMGLSGPRIEATSLIGQTFTIVRAKPFNSSFGQDRNPWFCVILLPGDDQPYTVVIGGGCCTEMLEAFAQAEIDRPLQVTLEWVEGGRFSGYYQFS